MAKRLLFNSLKATALLLLLMAPMIFAAFGGRGRSADFDRAFAKACGGTYECAEITDVKKVKDGVTSVQAAYTAAKDGQVQVYVAEMRVRAGAEGTFSVLVGIDRFSLAITGISIRGHAVSDTSGALYLLADTSYLSRFYGCKRADVGQIPDRTGADSASRGLRRAITLAFDLVEELKESEEHI